MKKLYKKGISLIETMLVLSIIGVLISVVSFEFLKIKERQVLKNTIADTISLINKARSQTLSSLNSSEYGVHFDSGRVIIFKGVVFSEGGADNKIFNLTSPATISNVTLSGVSGSSGDMYFGRLYGLPSKAGTISISTNSFSKIINISITGAVSVN